MPVTAPASQPQRAGSSRLAQGVSAPVAQLAARRSHNPKVASSILVWSKTRTSRLAQLVERKTLNLVVVGSSPTVGAPSFCLIFCSRTRSRSAWLASRAAPIGWMAERSKALVLGTSLFGGVGSNPTPIKQHACSHSPLV